jgi:nucleoside-diphosphate-sugar epimerase
MNTFVVTGGTGFLGSELTKRLVRSGHRVIVLKRKQSNLLRLQPILHDLLTYNVEDGLSSPFEAGYSVEAILHTASCYGRNAESASEVVASNLGFPLKLLEVAASAGTSLFVNADTALHSSVNSYALSKHQFRTWGKALAEEGKIKFLNVRLEQFYGPGDDLWKFPMHVILSCVRDVPELRLTQGDQKRDFVYISDVVEAFRILLENALRDGQGYASTDVGTGKPVSIRAFVELVQRITGAQTKLIFGAVPYRQDEVMLSESDTRSLRAFGWSPEVDLDAGIRNTIEGLAHL